MIIDILGDICLAYYSGNLSQLENTADKINKFLGNVDYRIANLENPILPTNCLKESCKCKKTGPNLCMDSKYAFFLDLIDVDAYILANNHIGDYGEGGINSTESFLKSIGKSYNGIVGINEDYIPIRIQDETTKVAFFNVCENEFGTAELLERGAAGFDSDKMKKALHNERQYSDYVFIIFHGGIEALPIPGKEQRKRYRALIEHGADGVIGMHQHCPCGMEYYKGKPIYYGIGNFYFPQKKKQIFDAAWYYGYIVRLSIDKDVNDRIILYTCDFNGNHKILDESRARIYWEALERLIDDSGYANSLYKVWAWVMGEYHLQSLWTDVKKEDDNAYLIAKNLFSCESVSELIKCYLKTQYTGEIIDTKNSKEEVARYINCDILNDYPPLQPESIIWGVTDSGIDKLELLSVKTNSVESNIIFIDKDVRKQGFRCGGCIILSPEEAISKYKNAKYYLCIPSQYKCDAKRELMQAGIEEKLIYE